MAGHIRTRRNKDGTISWCCIVTVGYGRGAHRISRTACRTERMQPKPPRRAVEMLRAMEREAEYGAVAPRRLSMDGLLDRWLNDDVRPRLAAKTVYGYERIVEAHLKPAFGHIRAPELRPLQLADYYAAKRDAGLADTTIHSHYRVLHIALSWAVRMELVPRNVADATKPPRGESQEMRTITSSQMRELAEAAKDTPLEIPVLLGVSTGARHGEVMAVRWGDLDLAAASCWIARSIQEVPGTERSYKRTKSNRERLVPLPQFAVERLKAIRAERLHQPEELVCPTVRARKFSDLWRDIIRENGHEGLRFHDLRHSYATALLERGVPVGVVQEILGHTTPVTTMNVYAHVTERMRRIAADAVNGAFDGVPERHGSGTAQQIVPLR